MGVWVDSVEARARIIHGQAAAARALASRNRADPDEFARPYLDLLGRLYREEFPFGRARSFVGVVREIDLDAKRFEIRHVADVGAIRCVYGPHMEGQARRVLDKRVRVEGQYETLPNRKPRLIAVSSMDVLVEEQQPGLL